MKTETIHTAGEEETIAAGRTFAEELGPGDVVCLHGDLGAGKTHFIKGIASFFGISERDVSSPTFVLIQEYPGDLPVYHFDAYRLESEKDAKAIGTEDYLYGDGISLIEWPEKMGTLIPDYAIHITIEKTGPLSRTIRIVKPG